ncbi:hypothetical protein OG203_24635 [Nocardia sp. NBC_01499]|uniref:hypothetical protein n=1 Tax=Nocardia sp. NBC_01499 TaxID=2903597 RepID=UPI00386B530C
MGDEQEQNPALSGRQKGQLEAIRRGWLKPDDTDQAEQAVDASTRTGRELGLAEAARRFGNRR